jgi:RNA polymerase sigma-B factor
MTETLASHRPDRIDAAERASLTHTLFGELAAADDDRREFLIGEITALYADVAEQIARRYSGRGEDVDELRQVAYVGLMKAINGYQPERGDLLPYAVTTMSGEVKRHFRDRCWDIRPTRRVQELDMRMSRAGADLEQELGRSPTVAELADRIEESPEDVSIAMHSRTLFNLMSTDAPLSDPGSQCLGDTLGHADRGFDRAEASIMLRTAVATCGLSARDRQVLGLRFFRGLTQREIAAEIGVTQMQVSRILARVLAVLRDQLDAEG